jgi:hypothetical protein
MKKWKIELIKIQKKKFKKKIKCKKNLYIQIIKKIIINDINFSKK